MDGIESIGMPASLPLAQVVERTPYSVSLRSRESRDTLGETRRADLAAASSALNDEKEKKIGEDFESVLLTKLFEQVQSSIEDSGFDEEDSGAQQVRGMFWLYLAQMSPTRWLRPLEGHLPAIRQMQGEADPSRAQDEEL